MDIFYGGSRAGVGGAMTMRPLWGCIPGGDVSANEDLGEEPGSRSEELS